MNTTASGAGGALHALATPCDCRFCGRYGAYDGGDSSQCNRRYRPDSSVTANTPVIALFENLAERCCTFISGASRIAGCVAWLTNESILTALAGVPSVSVIVQKEDFLRPDSGRVYKPRLHALYKRLGGTGPSYRLQFPETGDLSTCSEVPGDDCAVRCMGIVSRSQKIAVPRMHHKFLVRYEAVRCSPDSAQNPVKDEWPSCTPWATCPGHDYPAAVWTGSFNMTHNGSNSLENAVMIFSPEIAQRYHEEWAWVYSLSEPLDWTRDWVEPELRIGS